MKLKCQKPSFAQESKTLKDSGGSKMTALYIWPIFSLLVRKLLQHKSEIEAKPKLNQAQVIQKVVSVILRINLYFVESAIGFPNTYLLDSDLSGG